MRDYTLTITCRLEFAKAAPPSIAKVRPLRHIQIMDYSSIITFEPGKRGGKPCIRGMRISVSDVLGWLAGGQSVAEIIEDFPELTEDDIRACLAFGSELANREPGDQAA